MTIHQLNIRLPEPVINEINDLAKDYGSQAKVVIAAVSKLSQEINLLKELKMSKTYYAAGNSYGTSFTYGSDGWFVHTFPTADARDAWVVADDYPNGNPTREAITAKQAPRIRRDEDWIEH